MSAPLSVRKGIELFPVTLNHAPAVIPSGIYKETVCRSSTATAPLQPPINTHTHTQDERWDMIIAHPPCTYLSAAGNGYFNIERYGHKAEDRFRRREEAVDFFLKFVRADCAKICIENPVGYMNTHFRKPEQTIHPYFFANSEDNSDNYHLKRTCLWLKGLSPLQRETFLDAPPPIYIDKSGKKRYRTDAISGSNKNKKLRSKTFPGIAKAMAEQWG